MRADLSQRGSRWSGRSGGRKLDSGADMQIREPGIEPPTFLQIYDPL